MIDLIIKIYLLGVAITLLLLFIDVIPRYKSRLHLGILIFASILTAACSWWSVFDWVIEKIKRKKEL